MRRVDRMFFLMWVLGATAVVVLMAVILMLWPGVVRTERGVGMLVGMAAGTLLAPVAYVISRRRVRR